MRFRKGQDNWHTARHGLPQRAKYKRGYFAEWRWGDQVKDELLSDFDYYIDASTQGEPAIVSGDDYRKALAKAAVQPFRMVPYFDPGVWGGDWMKSHFSCLRMAATTHGALMVYQRKIVSFWISEAV